MQKFWHSPHKGSCGMFFIYFILFFLLFWYLLHINGNRKSFSDKNTTCEAIIVMTDNSKHLHLTTVYERLTHGFCVLNRDMTSSTLGALWTRVLSGLCTRSLINMENPFRWNNFTKVPFPCFLKQILHADLTSGSAYEKHTSSTWLTHDVYWHSMRMHCSRVKKLVWTLFFFSFPLRKVIATTCFLKTWQTLNG